MPTKTLAVSAKIADASIYYLYKDHVCISRTEIIFFFDLCEPIHFLILKNRTKRKQFFYFNFLKLQGYNKKRQQHENETKIISISFYFSLFSFSFFFFDVKQ